MAKKTGDERWKDLDITKDEVDRIGKALKNEEFRKMFLDYAKEISDPKNREIYEQEIAQMEGERGMDVQFIHPKPGHVIKVTATVSGSPDKKKVFVNICHNEALGKPTHEKKKKPNGSFGLQWSIPHSFSPAREDLDKQGKKCSVYDVVFHPDTYKMSTNHAFLTMLHDTAIEGLERQFGISIERDSVVKLSNMKFKGRVEPTVMRKRKADGDANDGAKKDSNKENDPLSKFPYPYEQNVTSEELANKKAKEVEESDNRRKAREAEKKTNDNNNNGDLSAQNEADNGGVITPHYTITNQYGVDMADFTQSVTGTPMHSLANAPANLVVSIHLPKLKSAKPCQLDVTERNLTLESLEPVAYKLDLKLPYPVDDENGSAKFDKTKKRLVVTLPVRKDKLEKEVREMSANLHNNNAAAGPLVNGADDTDLTNGETMTGTPLIQELSSSSASQDGATANQSNTENKDQIIADVEPHEKEASHSLKLDEKIPYKLPKLSYEQDEESVTVVLEVARVRTDTFKSAYHENTVELMFSTTSPSGFPSHYFMKCEFPSSISQISRSIGQTNVAISITKETKGLWNGFKTRGQDSSKEFQEHEFVSASHIEQELEHLEQKSAKTSAAGDNDVTTDEDVLKQHLTIDIQAATAPQTAPEVVHKQSGPAKPGILKRTISESSTDDYAVNHSAGGDSHSHNSTPSPNGSSEGSSADLLPSPRERKKSVSFNDKDEELVFKAKESVCVMHKTLLNRRKKHRQREHRREEGKTRRNSGGDISSDDQHHSSHTNNKKKSGRNRRRRNSSGSGSVTSEDGDSPRSPITYPVEEVNDENDHEHGECTCSQEERDVRKAMHPTDVELVEEKPETKSIATEPGEKQRCKMSKPVKETQNTEANDETELNSDDDEHPGESNHNDKDKNGNVDLSSEPHESFMEKTKCAFDFSNSVIFDLDE